MKSTIDHQWAGPESGPRLSTQSSIQLSCFPLTYLDHFPTSEMKQNKYFFRLSEEKKTKKPVKISLSVTHGGGK